MRLCAFNGQVTPVPPSTTQAPIWMTPTAAGRDLIQEFVFSGFASSSTPMQTRVARCSDAGTTPPAAVVLQRLDQTLTAPGGVTLAKGNAAWATGPTIVAGGLLGACWNAYGGLYRWLAAPGEEIDMALTGNYTVICADNGAGVSAYAATFIEL